MAERYYSRVYTDRPAYADFDAPAKFQAIQSIVAKHLKQHPNAICSYSGGADSDILLVKAAWNVFGKSYTYRQKYNAYKAERMEQEKAEKRLREQEEYQGISLFDTVEDGEK